MKLRTYPILGVGFLGIERSTCKLRIGLRWMVTAKVRADNHEITRRRSTRGDAGCWCGHYCAYSEHSAGCVGRHQWSERQLPCGALFGRYLVTPGNCLSYQVFLFLGAISRKSWYLSS